MQAKWIQLDLFTSQVIAYSQAYRIFIIEISETEVWILLCTIVRSDMKLGLFSKNGYKQYPMR